MNQLEINRRDRSYVSHTDLLQLNHEPSQPNIEENEESLWNIPEDQMEESVRESEDLYNPSTNPSYNLTLKQSFALFIK